MNRAELIDRIWERDPTVWTGADEAKWLGWLDEPRRMRERVGDLRRGGLTVRPLGRLARCGDEPLPLLAGRLRDELLGPQAEATIRVLDADLVAPLLPAFAELAAELVAGIAAVLAADADHALGICKEPVDVDSHQRRRHDPEGRQRRVAAADRRLACEHLPESTFLGEALQIGAGIGDRDEIGRAHV